MDELDLFHSPITYCLLTTVIPIYYLTFVRLVQQSNTLLPHTLVPRGLWISVIGRQSLHWHRRIYTADGTSTVVAEPQPTLDII